MSIKDIERYLERCVLDESLAEHDMKYHPDGYKEGDECNKREAMAKNDDHIGLADNQANGFSKPVIEAIDSIPDDEFSDIYHGSKEDFLNSGVGVLFSDLPEQDKAYYDPRQKIIFVSTKLNDDKDALAKAIKHELVHVRQTNEGENVPAGFDPQAGDISALKYFVDPGELEARYAEEGRLSDFKEVKEALTSPLSDKMEDVEIGEMKVVDWNKSVLTPQGIRQLQRASLNDKTAAAILKRSGAGKSDRLLPAKMAEIGERIMNDDEGYHVGTAIGYPVMNPSAYTRVTMPNGKIRMEVLGRVDQQTGKRKNINPVSIARQLSELGIKASAVGPNEINIFATQETVSKLGDLKKAMSSALPFNGVN